MTHVSLTGIAVIERAVFSEAKWFLYQKNWLAVFNQKLELFVD